MPKTLLHFGLSPVRFRVSRWFAAFILIAILALMAGCGGGSSSGNPTTTSLTASATDVTLGTSIRFIAVVMPSGATGSVNFHDGSTGLGASTIISGGASLDITNLTVGTHTITATYAGDDTHLSSTSAPLTVTIR